MRAWLLKNSLTVNIICVVVIFAAVIGGFLLTRPPHVEKFDRAAIHVFYFDLTTSKLFEAPDAAPPIAAPSDVTTKDRHSGVRAFVYSCTDCAQAQTRFTAYLATYSLKGQQVANEVGLDDASPQAVQKAFEAANESRLVADAASLPISFVPETTIRGKSILARLEQPCPTGNLPTECHPKAP